MSSNNHTVVGTIGGTFMSIVPNLESADVIKTVLLASLGAIVSFAISLALKCIIKKHKK